MSVNKTQLKMVLIIAALLLLSACSTERLLHKSYKGDNRPNEQLALFNWAGTWYMGLGLYKADGVPLTEENEGGTWPCMYNDRNLGGFNVAVLPGKRVFELFNAKTEPVSAFQVSFNMEAGKTYTLVGDEEKFVIMSGGKEVKFDVEPVPVFIEPRTGEPHGLLKLGGFGLNKTVALFRVDGKVSKPVHKCHPKWVTINKDIPFIGMSEFELRLSPGKHTIEYSVLSRIFGGRAMGFYVKTLTFNVKEGKSYNYKVIPDPNGGDEETIEIVEI